ncbi:G-protein coupled receptor GRL101-like [Amphiura filiformis]|uniref:G-protein coupled receptor GRL101-like n=1 Tax=Amphiura filiformis TaxID=82378 RepID=UPI003B21AAF6
MKARFMVEVPLVVINGGSFQGLKSLVTLVIVRGSSIIKELEVKTNAFDGMPSLQTMYNDDHRLCCFFSNLETCRTIETYSPLFNCGSMMQNQVLRVFMWVLGISAVVGNIFVIVLRMKEKTASETQSKQRLFIFHLALSDSLMGVYMIILACADIYYGDEYFKFSDAWRNGIVCRITGFLGLLSSEASVFFISLITIDRFICVAFPFGRARMTLTSSKTAVGFLWCVALVLSAVPVLLAGPDSDFYDLSDVCIGLPLITRPSSFNFESEGLGGTLNFNLPVSTESKPAWYFSIILFLVVNLACFVIIFICYVIMFVRVKTSAQQVGRKESFNDEIKMAIKMAAIVGTDFICWFPIILMGLLSQLGAVVIPLDAYVWSVVFILPINSSLNPYLYTITTLISDNKKK